MKPGDELFVWISTNTAGEDGAMSVIDKNSGFEGSLASTNLVVACAWIPLIEKIKVTTGYKCRLVRYEKREDVPDELVKETLVLALDSTGAEKAPH